MSLYSPDSMVTDSRPRGSLLFLCPERGYSSCGPHSVCADMNTYLFPPTHPRPLLNMYLGKAGTRDNFPINRDSCGSRESGEGI